MSATTEEHGSIPKAVTLREVTYIHYEYNRLPLFHRALFVVPNSNQDDKKVSDKTNLNKKIKSIKHQLVLSLSQFCRRLCST